VPTLDLTHDPINNPITERAAMIRLKLARDILKERDPLRRAERRRGSENLRQLIVGKM